MAAYMKQGKTAYSNTQVNTAVPAPGGIMHCEFTQPGALSQMLVLHGSILARGDTGLTGSYTTVDATLNPEPLGLWGVFANDSYFLNNGVDPQKKFTYDTRIGSYVYRSSGLKPPTEQPTVTPQEVGTSSTSRNYLIENVSTGLDMTNPQFTYDGSEETYAYKTLDNTGQRARKWQGNYLGLPNGSDYSANILMETHVFGGTNAEGTTTIEYSLTGTSGTYITAYTVPNGFAKQSFTISFIGTLIDPTQLFFRTTTNKTNNPGKLQPRIYDTVVYKGAALGGQTIATGVVYAITEANPTYGIESIAGPRSITTGQAENVYANRISLPATASNPLTTHFGIYRTSDGGAWPTATRVAYVPIGTLFYDDITIFLQTASNNTYGSHNLGGLTYDRDVEPPIATSICEFQDQLICAPVDEPNVLRASAPSFNESWPLYNRFRMSSDKDDRVMSISRLGSSLGVFMKGRCRRIDHIPTISDPTFNLDADDFAPDHGLASRNGMTQFMPSDAGGPKIAYVAHDGIRVTNLYQSEIVTSDLLWEDLVDVTQLETSSLRDVASENRLEFYFTPTQATRDEFGWPSTTTCCMWLQYTVRHTRQEPLRFTISINPVKYVAVSTAPWQGTSYSFILAPDSRVYVDQVGITDPLMSFDGTTTTIQRMITTGRIYHPEYYRWRCQRLYVEHPGIGGGESIITVTSGRDDTGTTASITFTNSGPGKVGQWTNISGQWIQISYNMSSNSNTPDALNEFNILDEAMGAFV